ncbi:hypothetical protein EDEG_03643 [Edhazardia aedis USNM 41457]|uniref:Uncharacterized protein n=1 Tax=Edhazardia aedis (strain USNM 41457) TaxID=1003232 RepID=J9D2R0_EDHAE|nr:hypothetical protein EDEG_03643 [Edhazardia aedis USNM 41457]|eukprot:EJW01869.1 hypothetical protein EDEG_03643 [Edhazardia aedis USNM 41457]
MIKKYYAINTFNRKNAIIKVIDFFVTFSSKKRDRNIEMSTPFKTEKRSKVQFNPRENFLIEEFSSGSTFEVHEDDVIETGNINQNENSEVLTVSDKKQRLTDIFYLLAATIFSILIFVYSIVLLKLSMTYKKMSESVPELCAVLNFILGLIIIIFAGVFIWELHFRKSKNQSCIFKTALWLVVIMVINYFLMLILFSAPLENIQICKILCP